MTSLDTPDQPQAGAAHVEPLVIGEPAGWLDEPMPTRRVREKLGRLTFVLLALVLATATYYLGVLSEKSSLAGTTASTGARGGGGGGGGGGGAGATAATGAATGTANGAAPGGGTGGGGGGGGATFGTVKLIDGSNLYVTDQSGTVVKIATTPDSVFTITATGTIKQVKPGDTVVVTGAAGADGTVTAATVRDQGTGGGFGGFGGGRNGGGRNGGGGATASATPNAGG